MLSSLGRCLLLLVRTHTARHASHRLGAGVTSDAINYATKNTTKMKAKLSYCDQIKFNERLLKQGTPE